jgi:glycosyltransferase involved in cell wall biosynthesis
VASAAADSSLETSGILFSVVVPTLGGESPLRALLASLEAQTLARERWELILAFDGTDPPTGLTADVAKSGAIVERLPERRGPGAARNAGARRASGGYLAFTEDDCVPDADWLATAAARLSREPSLDVLEGETRLPDGTPARRRHGDALTWLPTNLFVRRALFETIGGYHERFFDARRGIYFREDSDFGFTARDTGAHAAADSAPRVTHPREHPGWLDPIRWARRYEMDPLLAARHPESFRGEIEVVRWGPFTIRRPFVRACVAYVLAWIAAAAAATIGERGVAAWFLGVAALAALLVWSKWRLDPRKLPAVLLVPPILVAALLRGRARAYATRPGDTSSMAR